MEASRGGGSPEEGGKVHEPHRGTDQDSKTKNEEEERRERFLDWEKGGDTTETRGQTSPIYRIIAREFIEKDISRGPVWGGGGCWSDMSPDVTEE